MKILNYLTLGLIIPIYVAIVYFAVNFKGPIYLNTNIDVKEKFGAVQNLPNAVYDAIIRLKTEENKYFCTGFSVDGNYAITAAHCVEWLGTSEKIRVYDKNDTFTGVEAVVVGYNQRNDTAVIKGDFRNFKAVVIEKDRHGFASSTGPFLTCGYPYANKALYCSYATPVRMKNFSMLLKGALIPGMSGGPVFDLNTNKVVGLNSAVEEDLIVVNPLVGIMGSFGLE